DPYRSRASTKSRGVDMGASGADGDVPAAVGATAARKQVIRIDGGVDVALDRRRPRVVCLELELQFEQLTDVQSRVGFDVAARREEEDEHLVDPVGGLQRRVIEIGRRTRRQQCGAGWL